MVLSLTTLLLLLVFVAHFSSAFVPGVCPDDAWYRATVASPAGRQEADGAYSTTLTGSHAVALYTTASRHLHGYVCDAGDLIGASCVPVELFPATQLTAPVAAYDAASDLVYIGVHAVAQQQARLLVCQANLTQCTFGSISPPQSNIETTIALSVVGSDVYALVASDVFETSNVYHCTVASLSGGCTDLGELGEYDGGGMTAVVSLNTLTIVVEDDSDDDNVAAYSCPLPLTTVDDCDKTVLIDVTPTAPRTNTGGEPKVIYDTIAGQFWVFAASSSDITIFVCTSDFSACIFSRVDAPDSFGRLDDPLPSYDALSDTFVVSAIGTGSVATIVSCERVSMHCLVQAVSLVEEVEESAAIVLYSQSANVMLWSIVDDVFSFNSCNHTRGPICDATSAEKQCLNGGQCAQTGLCVCPSAFFGDLCEHTFTPCLSGPCQNGARCISPANSTDFTCECTLNFFGMLCERSLDAELALVQQTTDSTQLIGLLSDIITTSPSYSSAPNALSILSQGLLTAAQGLNTTTTTQPTTHQQASTLLLLLNTLLTAHTTTLVRLSQGPTVVSAVSISLSAYTLSLPHCALPSFLPLSAFFASARRLPSVVNLSGVFSFANVTVQFTTEFSQSLTDSTNTNNCSVPQQLVQYHEWPLSTRLERQISDPRAPVSWIGYASPLVSVSVTAGTGVTGLSDAARVRLTLPLSVANRGVGVAQCYSWSYALDAWSQAGCEVLMRNSTHVECACNHLSDFALLYDGSFPPQNSALTTSATVFVWVGSILALVMGVCLLLLLTVVPKLRTLVSKYVLNLTLALLLFDVLFPVAYDATSNEDGCRVAKTVLYYALSTIVVWSLICALAQLYSVGQTVDQLMARRIANQRAMFVLGWLVPIVPTVILTIYDLHVFNTTAFNVCWFSQEGLSNVVVVVVSLGSLLLVSLLVALRGFMRLRRSVQTMGSLSSIETVQKYHISRALMVFHALFMVSFILLCTAQSISTQALWLAFALFNLIHMAGFLATLLASSRVRELILHEVDRWKQTHSSDSGDLVGGGLRGSCKQQAIDEIAMSPLSRRRGKGGEGSSGSVIVGSGGSAQAIEVPEPISLARSPRTPRSGRTSSGEGSTMTLRNVNTLNSQVALLPPPANTFEQRQRGVRRSRPDIASDLVYIDPRHGIRLNSTSPPVITTTTPAESDMYSNHNYSYTDDAAENPFAAEWRSVLTSGNNSRHVSPSLSPAPETPFLHPLQQNISHTTPTLPSSEITLSSSVPNRFLQTSNPDSTTNSSSV